MAAKLAVEIIEIDLDYCSLRYGETTGAGTCPAVLGVDSAAKCFQSKKTCPVPDSFINVPVTVRFNVSAAHFPDQIESVPSLKSVSFDPATLSLGENLGERATLTAVFDDHPDSDTGPGGDQYLADRTYNPWDQGSYWGKFRARHPYIQARAIRWVTGFVPESFATSYPNGSPLPDDVLDDQATRHFVIDSFTGPTPKAEFTIVGKDVLKLADGDRAQAPLPSTGSLVADITDVATSFTLTPSGVGDSEYLQAGYLAIGGRECVQFKRGGGIDTTTAWMLHFNGSDASTTFTDSAPTPHTFTAAGNAQIDTAQSVFGGASGLFDGTGDYIEAASSTAFDLGDGDWAIDFRVRFNSTTGEQTLVDRRNPTGSRDGWCLVKNSSHKLVFRTDDNTDVLIGLTSLTTGAFHHVALVQWGQVVHLYLDGAFEEFWVGRPQDAPYALRLGASTASAANGFNGWIDEARGTIGKAPWQYNFAVPIQAYDATTGDAVTITRAQLNTVATALKAGDRAQQVLYFASKDPAYIVAVLYEVFCGVAFGRIPLDEWLAETDANFGQLFTAAITNPTSVNTLLSEIIQHGFASWWRDIEQTIGLQVLRGVDTSAAEFSEMDYIADTLTIQEQPDKRLTRYQLFFAQKSPLPSLTDESNFGSMAQTPDDVALALEEDYGAAAIKKQYSRFLPAGARTQADYVCAVQLSRYQSPPRKFNFTLLRDANAIAPAMAQGLRLSGFAIQDEFGAATAAPIQLTRVNPGPGLVPIEAEEALYTAPPAAPKVVTFDFDTMNPNLRTAWDLNYGPPSGGDTATFILRAGVTIGSISAALPAVDVGSWPVGVTVLFQIYGAIEGAGGNGGSGSKTAGVAGQAGGIALYTRNAITIEVGTGEIFGGGGGGGGGGGWDSVPFGGSLSAGGGGGGGGQGDNPGTAGPGGSGTGTGSPGVAGSSSAPGTGGAGSTAAGGNYVGANGGDGGAFGTAGVAGGTGFIASPFASNPGGAGGSAGSAIDGVSFVTVSIGPGDIRGPQIN